MQHNSFNFKLTFQLLLLGLVLTGAYKYQYFLDQYALATFHPTPEVAAIVDRLQLTPRARAILAGANPQLDDKKTFNADCETTVGELELGCYTHGRIYVLKIENADLAPEMDVVMAHELLHASYNRLGSGERKSVDANLEAAYGKINDSDLRTRMADYAKSEPGEQDNELNSILGTEFTNLGADLDAYYAGYFDSRKVITDAQAQYQNVFDSRRRQLESELSIIRSMKSQLSSLNRRMESLKNSGSIEAYNALVPQQNQLVDSINSRIQTYQQGVDEYNALSKALDSQQITTPAESTVQ